MVQDHRVVQGQVHATPAMGTDRSYHREDFFKSNRPVQIAEGPDKLLKIHALNAGEKEDQRN